MIKRYKKDQHFLIDENVLDRIVDYGKVNRSDTVLEIGAGYGNLTEKLAKKACRVVAFEIDSELAAAIKLKNVEVITGDVLSKEFPFFNKVISNLPYSISSQVTFKILEYKFDLGILMYQYEFAKRMAALPGSKDYGRLSIAVQYYADIEILEIVPGSAFSAPPDVNSAIIRIVPRPPPYRVKDKDFFMKFIAAAFSQRRKKLRNSLLNNAMILGVTERAIKKLPNELLEKRPEIISPCDLAELADILLDDAAKDIHAS